MSNAQAFTDLVRDAHRFFVHSKDFIENYPLQAYASALLFSPSGSLIRTAFQHEEPEWITIQPAISGTWSSCLYTFEGHCDAVAYSHKSNQLALGFPGGGIKFWDADSSTYLPDLEGQESTFYGTKQVKFFHDSARLAVISTSYYSRVRIWDIDTGTCLSIWDFDKSTFEQKVPFCNDVALHAFAEATGQDSFKLFDTAEAELLSFLTSPHYGARKEVESVFSHSGRFLAVNFSTNIKIWDASSHRHVQSLELSVINKESDSTFVASACVSDSALLAVGYISGKVIIFSVHSGKILHILQSGDTTVRGGAMSLEISHNSRKVAMSTGQSSFKIWDLSNTLNPQTLGGHGSIASVAFSPDSQNLVSRSVIGETKIWDISGDDCFQTLDEHEGVVDILAFSHDSTWLASGDNDSTVKIWNLHGRCLQTLQGHSGGITRIDVLPSPARVGSLSWDQTYRIWDVVSGQCLQTYECGEYANLFTLSPDSRLLARRASNRTYNIWPIQLWDVVEDVCLLTWEVDSAASIYSFAFSSDSTQLAVLMNWSVIKIFHTGSGKCLQTLDPRYEIPGSPELAPGDGRYSVTFLKDATLLASAWSDGNIRIWDGNSGRCLHAVKTGPQFSNLTFDQSRCFLRTDHGRIAIPTSSELEDYMAALTTGFLIVHGVGVSLDGKWITYNSVNVLWLPLEYRPRRSAVSGNLIAIADGKKVRVFILYPDRLKYL